MRLKRRAARAATRSWYKSESIVLKGFQQVPAQLKVIEHVGPKMACSKCKGVVVLVAPLPAEGATT